MKRYDAYHWCSMPTDVSSYKVCILVIGLCCLVNGAPEGSYMLSGDQICSFLKTID